jgi:hypothetical protein
MPTRHSSVAGGSSAARIVNCPGSTAMLAKLPPVVDRDSFYSLEGTALHDLIGQVITRKVTMAKLPKVIETHGGPIEITQTLVHDALLPALGYWNEFKKKVNHWQLETEVAFPGLPGAFGTADVLGRSDKTNTTYVTDWKFGAGEGVKAVYPDPDNPFFEIINEQLMFYGAAARHTYPQLFPPGCKVVLTIVQPRARGQDPITSAEVTLADLDAFAEELRAAVTLKDPPTKKGRWCRFAACQTICPHHTGPLLDLTTTVITKQPETDPAYIEKLLTVLDVAPMVEGIIREARSQAHLILGNGGEVPGWKLVAKRGNRQWTVDETTLAKTLKIAKKKLYDTTLKSPAGVEKIIGKKKLPEGLTTIVSSGTTIAPVSDKRPAVSGDPNEISKIMLAVLSEAE